VCVSRDARACLCCTLEQRARSGGASIARSAAMSDDRSEDDPIMDLWYSNWEQQCVEALESEPDYENQLHNEKELYSQQMWTKFQTTASAIAQLYKGDSYVPAATYVSHTSDVTPPPPPLLARARRRRRPRGRLSRVTSVPGSREGYENDPPIRVAVSRHSRCRDSFVLVALGAVLRNYRSKNIP